MRGLLLVFLAAFAGGKGPVWSPDGSHLAYIGPAAALNRVVVAGTRGTGTPRTVARAPMGQTLNEVRWGAGGRLVYSDSNYTLWSSGRRIATLGVTSGAGESFALSPDGREVAFTAPCNCDVAQGDTVAVVPVTGGKARILVRGKDALAEYPSFSPDGRRVVFTRILGRSGELVVETLATGAQHVIHVFGQWAAFSPDGRSIAFLGTRGLEVIPASGGVPRTALPFHYVDGTASFSWSPDSHELAYVTSTKAGIVDLSGHLTRVALPGLRPGLDTSEWSPDGKSLAFSAIAKGNDLDQRVYVVGADGSGLRRVA